MAEETLDVQQGDQQVAEPAVEQAAAPSEQLTQEQVLAMLEDVKVEAKREAALLSEEAFRRSQSKIDQDIARERASWQSQYETLRSTYGEFAIAQGADPDALETLNRQTQTEVRMKELQAEAQAYRELKAQTEAEQAKRDQIRRTCAKYKIDLSHPRLVTDQTFEDFAESVLDIRAQRLERREKDAEREAKKQDLETLREAGGLDVTGGGAAMAAPAWSTAQLAPDSEESLIAGRIIHHFNRPMTVEELGQKTKKALQIMKSDPRFTDNPAGAAKRVYEMETFGH